MSERDIETVKAAAKKTGEDFLGVTKAFIADVHAELVSGGRSNLSLDAFKTWLCREQRAGTINLSRCDLVEAHSASKVAASETSNGINEYHFIRV
jgi:hypothetical protein